PAIVGAEGGLAVWPQAKLLFRVAGPRVPDGHADAGADVAEIGGGHPASIGADRALAVVFQRPKDSLPVVALPKHSPSPVARDGDHAAVLAGAVDMVIAVHRHEFRRSDVQTVGVGLHPAGPAPDAPVAV